MTRWAPERERKALRGIVGVVVVLAAASLAFALLPSYARYDWKPSPCAVGLFTMHSHVAAGCASTSTYVDTVNGLDDDLCAVLLVLVAPGLIVVWRPQLIVAALWPVMAFACAGIAFVRLWGEATGLSLDRVELWPARVTIALVEVLCGLVILALPLACIVYAVMTRPRSPALPRARVVM